MINHNIIERKLWVILLRVVRNWDYYMHLDNLS